MRVVKKNAFIGKKVGMFFWGVWGVLKSKKGWHGWDIVVRDFPLTLNK